MKRVLALREDGEITFCSAPLELRGKGRCNHIAHQEEGQTPEDFIKSISSKIRVDSPSDMPDLNDAIVKLVTTYGRVDNPNWEEVISSIDNTFHIGSKENGTFEEAKMISFEQSLRENEDGNTYKLTAFYEFRGRIYECDFGEVPVINGDGTITVDGVDWRVLPVVEQRKAGLISYYDNITVRQDNGKHVAFSMSKDPNDDTIKIYGKNVPIDAVQNYFLNGGKTGLNSGQIYALESIDPIAFERFPNLRTDIRSLKDLPVDEVGDLNYRRVIRYEDMVKEQIQIQMRRMGVTFRQNLAKQVKALESNPEESLEALNERFPLFYQVNITENIKSDLVGRSNVQYADNLNPISALSQSQKISLTGKGGFNKDKVPYELRLPHMSHEHIIDAMDISSGKNVGLTSTLSYGYIGDDRMIYRKNRDECIGPSDFIPYREHNDPNRAIMAVAHLKQACPILGGEEPIVKTPAWNKIAGSKIGVNLNIAYIPNAGVFEDAVIISQSAADRMKTIKSQKYNCYDEAALKNLKIGQRVERKQIIGGKEVKVGGTIKSIGKEHFEVETIYSMGPGDKLSGRHGNKSVVSKVVPDHKMPKMINASGKEEAVDVIMSPLSVVGRKNLGQVMEINETMGDGPAIDIKRNVILPDGHKIEASAGKQFILRLNHLVDKKISSHADEQNAKLESEGCRLGEMESILLSTNKNRLKILEYLRHQDAYDSHNKLNSLLKAVGVTMSGVNWERK